MLTPAPAARSFSELLFDRMPASVDDGTDAQQGHRRDVPDHASYFDTIMRLRCRHPIARCRRVSHS